MEVETNTTTNTSQINGVSAFDSSSTNSAMQQSQSNNNTFGLIIPGGPVRTDFIPVDNSGTKFSLTLRSPGDLPSPLSLVNELVGFLIGSPLPPNHGLLLYWQLSNQQGQQSGFELLGSLTMDSPSQIFRTGWSEHDQFMAIPPYEPVTVTIGLSVEPLESVNNLVGGGDTNNLEANNKKYARRPMVAQKIAQDLHNFMQSFDTGVAGRGNMVVPQNIFERWWKRFEARSQRDPNFFLKNSD